METSVPSAEDEKMAKIRARLAARQASKGAHTAGNSSNPSVSAAAPAQTLNAVSSSAAESQERAAVVKAAEQMALKTAEKAAGEAAGKVAVASEEAVKKTAEEAAEKVAEREHDAQLEAAVKAAHAASAIEIDNLRKQIAELTAAAAAVKGPSVIGSQQTVVLGSEQGGVTVSESTEASQGTSRGEFLQPVAAEESLMSIAQLADLGAMSRQDFEVLRPLGKGAFGQVTLVTHVESGSVMVWKEIDYGKLNPEQLAMVVCEVKLLKSFSHPHIVAYYGCIVEAYQRKVLLLMEYCSGGDLEAQLKHYKKVAGKIPKPVALKITAQLCLALHALASHEGGNAVIHRDIKPCNVFLDQDLNVKLGDFGLACVHGGERHQVKKPVGTMFYMAPEMINGHKTSSLTDVWAVGCVLYEMLTGKRVFEASSREDLKQKVFKGHYNKLPPSWPPELCELIYAMLQPDPFLRADVNTLLQMPPVDSAVLREEGSADGIVSPTQQKWRQNEQASRLEVERCRQAMQQSEAAMIDTHQALDTATLEYESDANALQIAKEKLLCAQGGLQFWNGNMSPARYHNGDHPVLHSPSPLKSKNAVTPEAVDITALSFLF